MTDTIAAIATARAPAAIGIVRISGPETLAVVDGVFAACSGKSAAALPHRRMVYGHMRTAEGAVIDDGLCVIFAPESSYTGEWSAELHCHGSAVVLEEVAKMAYRTETINPKVAPAPTELQDKHYFRKHGANAYYGQ